MLPSMDPPKNIIHALTPSHHYHLGNPPAQSTHDEFALPTPAQSVAQFAAQHDLDTIRQHQRRLLHLG